MNRQRNFKILMKLKKMSQFGLLALVALPLCSGYGQSPVAPSSSSAASATNINSSPPPANLPPNVAEVVKLSSAGLGNDVVLAFVNSSQSLFGLSANDILQLKTLGVSPTIITAMLNHDSSLRNSYPPRQPNYVNSQPPPPSANPGQTDQPATQPDTSTAVVAQPAPPAPVEYIPVAPSPDYYWTPGYWWWNGGWVWIGGGWGWGGYHGGYWGWGGYHGGGGYHGSGGYHGGGGGYHGSDGHGGGHH